MKIKICGIFREKDIDYVNEALPDYIGFVFAESSRKVTGLQATRLKDRLSGSITAEGVFVNDSLDKIAAFYRGGVISIAQLHGNEDQTYIDCLKEICEKDSGMGYPLSVIKTIQSAELERMAEDPAAVIPLNADYYLIDSGAGSGESFNWRMLKPGGPLSLRLNAIGKPWFLAGGITVKNIKKAIALNPFCIDVSSGAETDGIKDQKKILQLTAMVKKGK
jgi:phosphoribosylanthranilate isomerase